MVSVRWPFVEIETRDPLQHTINMETGKRLDATPAKNYYIYYDLSFTTDADSLVTVSNVPTGKKMHTFNAHGPPMTSVASPMVLHPAGSGSNRFVLTDIRSGKRFCHLPTLP